MTQHHPFPNSVAQSSCGCKWPHHWASWQCSQHHLWRHHCKLFHNYHSGKYSVWYWPNI